jgi:hypothetical protein
MLPAAFSPFGRLRAHKRDALRVVRAHVPLRTLRPSKWLRPYWTSVFEYSLIFLKWSLYHSNADEKTNYLKYSTAPFLVF